MENYDIYLNEQFGKLEQLLHDAGCRPMLFIGSGLSRRYINAPDWTGLMKFLVEQNPKINFPYGYYFQKANGDLSKFASLLVDSYQEYAWQTHGDGTYPNEVFEEGYEPSIFLKTAVSKHLNKLLADIASDNFSNHSLKDEIEAFRKIQPHAIITTNYDEMLETLFPDYNVIVGQEIIRKHNYSSIGEILKIHGSVTSPESLVLTHEDYTEFVQRKKYLSAKLLTSFAEFPMILIGYSANDENIKGILFDISEMVVTTQDELVPNIWIVEWNENPDKKYTPPTEKILNLGNGRTLRINYIEVANYLGIGNTLSKPIPITTVNVRLLRALAANVYQIVTNKSAKTDISVKLELLKQHSDEEQLSKVLGFGDAEPADALGTGYPFILNDVAKKLGYDYWHYANQLILKVAKDTGFNIKESNNKYHQETKYGKNKIHRYSNLAIKLLTLVRDRKDYTIDPPNGKSIKIKKT